MSQKKLLSVRGLRKSYPTPAEDLVVLDGLDLELEAGESLAVVGPSGSGKSTLLHLLGTLDPPTGGELVIDGERVLELDEPALAAFRNRRIGFVFQDHHLLPHLTAIENVLVPAMVGGGVTAGDASWAKALLERVGLGPRASHLPGELSGGERQRVAVARALIHRPVLLLADEPTGNLDARNAAAIRDLFLELHRAEGNVLVVVTHSADLARAFDRRLEIRDGKGFFE